MADENLVLGLVDEDGDLVCDCGSDFANKETSLLGDDGMIGNEDLEESKPPLDVSEKIEKKNISSLL